MGTEWTGELVRSVLSDPAGRTANHENHYLIYRMLQALYRRQTPDEKGNGVTVYRNGMGFNSIDAPILTSIAERSKAYRDLTPKQAALVGSLLQKYVGQIVQIIQENTGGTDAAA